MMRHRDDSEEQERRAVMRCASRRAYMVPNTLYARVGHQVAQAIAAKLVRCQRHGYRVAIDACPCVLQDGIVYFANAKAAACAVHYRDLQSDDQRVVNNAAAVFERVCSACVADVGSGEAADQRLDEFRRWLGAG